MRVIVQKYGGSSVADLDKLRQVAHRVAASVDRDTGVVVVVSAMGNTTNELLALARQVSPDPDRRELDMLISVGERISMALLAMALREQGVPAVSLTGSQSGIITDENHAGAQVVEVRPSRVRACLEQGLVVIVAGFQGVSRQREVTTLGRGGSDTTAVAMAAALHAEYCELVSDVDGVWSADPRQAPEARRCQGLSWSEALALARGGAKVLAEDAVRYAAELGVAIQASALTGPGAGTRISATASGAAGAVAVAADTQLVAVRVAGLEGARALWAAGYRQRRSLGHRVLLDTRNAHGRPPGHPELSWEGEVAVVTAVGPGLGARALPLQRARSALDEAGVVALSSGASGDEAWWEVSPEQAQRAIAVLHRVLVQEPL